MPTLVSAPRATALLVGLLGLGACREAPPPEFRIGLLNVDAAAALPISSLPALHGAELAVEELNAAGGVTIGGIAHRVVLREQRFANRPEAAASGARALANLDSVHAIIGPQFTTHAVAAGAVAEAAALPLISPMASGPAVTTGRSYVFRLAFVDAFQGRLLADYAYDSLRLRRAAALYDGASPYGRDIVRLFRETFEARGGTFVGEETFSVDAPVDYRAPLARLVARSPDALLLPNFAVYDSVQIRQARALGFRGRFLGSDAWDPPSLSRVAGAAGSVVVANWDPRSDWEAARTFVARYRARHAETPRTTAAASYDAVMLLAAAARRAGSLEGAALATALRQAGVHEGASARFEFVGHGDPRRGAAVLELLDGRDTLRLFASPR